MKIIKVTELTSKYIETDAGIYKRHDSNTWFAVNGEENYRIYDCEELEKVYMRYQASLMSWLDT